MPFFLQRFLRRPLPALCAAAVSFAFAVLLGWLAQYSVSQEQELERTKSTFRIRCVVANVQGSRTSRLDMPQKYVDCLIGNGEYAPSSYISDLELTREFDYEQVELPGSGVAYAVNRPECADDLKSGLGGAEFFDLYDGDFYQDTDPVCLVSQQVWNMLSAGIVQGEEEKERTIQLKLYDRNDLSKSETVSLRIVGIHPGDEKTIYLPWSWAAGYMMEQSGALFCDSASFYLRDNRQLAEVEELSAHFFRTVDYGAGQTVSGYALIIHDEQYKSVLSVTQQNLTRVHMVIPVLMILSLCIGFLASFLNTRSQHRTYSLMRTLGIGKTKVFLTALSEQYIPGVLGGIAGIICSLLLEAQTAGSTILLWTAYILCYLFGCLFAVLRIAVQSPMKLMKEEK